ncbi:hypothetical protein [Marixanthomonas spongiae]|uniref:STAS/SEC14 domain-containing protein n=1 Tax=Marixanthomonas spongiae TaxID=2174845 RepID=A0A2U0I3L3_9FLAO|nr:hypothetical protein [Marixanthomonas spongiae]PVW15654.1 hypothetical protein DDV96_05120 [Marixanthomonas spongiae]
MVQKINTDFCELHLYTKYAILKVFENVFYDVEKATIVQRKFQDFFENKPFVLISDRNIKHEVDFKLYKSNTLQNIEGLAIVSANPEERERAVLEQPHFSKSFAFFEKLGDAQNWAEAFFR